MAHQEQCHDLPFALDLALAHNSDDKLGAALRRNILIGRSARAIPYPGSNVELPPDGWCGANELDETNLYKNVKQEAAVQPVEYVRVEVGRLADAEFTVQDVDTT